MQVALKSTGIWLSWKLSHGNDCRTVCDANLGSFLPPCGTAYSNALLLLLLFSINSLEKYEALNPMKYIYIYMMVWSWAKLLNLLNWEILNTTDWLEKKCKAKSRFTFVILKHKSLFLLPESAVDCSQLVCMIHVLSCKQKIRHEPLVCAYIRIHLLLYICVHIYVHPHTPPSTHTRLPTHTHAHACMNAHKTVVLL